jgi:hypothetical protein
LAVPTVDLVLTDKTFESEHNQRWLEVTRPIVEAFFHARGGSPAHGSLSPEPAASFRLSLLVG